MVMDLNSQMQKIDNRLRKYMDDIPVSSRVKEAMKYSLMSGGKRIRPYLLLEFYSACGGGVDDIAVSFACALEMIHTYSLIHDDLPCMDDSDMRRGKPSNHTVFGDDFALLAGDALLTKAFEIVSDVDELEQRDAKVILRCVNLLSKAAGVEGMVLGQEIDILSENKIMSEQELQVMDQKKTGELIKVAVMIGCTLAGAGESQMIAAKKYAEALGLMFQIVDDILDVTAESELVGKPTGNDEKNNKSTYVSIYGLSKSKEKVVELTNIAIDALKDFEGDVNGLKEFAKKLAQRTF